MSIMRLLVDYPHLRGLSESLIQIAQSEDSTQDEKKSTQLILKDIRLLASSAEKKRKEILPIRKAA